MKRMKSSMWMFLCVLAIALFVIVGIPAIIIIAAKTHEAAAVVLLVIALVMMAAGLVAFHPEIGLWKNQESMRDGKKE